MYHNMAIYQYIVVSLMHVRIRVHVRIYTYVVIFVKGLQLT